MPHQEGIISEIYQRPDKNYFQEPKDLESLVDTSKIVQKFLPKQANIDQIYIDNSTESTQGVTFVSNCERNSGMIFT